MKRLIAILSVLLLVLTACAPSQTGAPSVQPGVKTGPGAATTGETSEARIIEEVKAATEAKNDATKNVIVPINSKEAEPGDFVVFGTMFNLVNRQGGTYLAKIMFIEARDSNSNKIETNPDTMRSWLVQSETPYFQVATGGSQFVPVQFRVGSEIKPGVETPPGSYQYEVQFYKVDGDFVNIIDTDVKKIFVKVE